MSTPRISLNKLAEYIHSDSAIRRRQILEGAMAPKKTLTTRYRDARETIKNFIMNDYDDKVIEAGITALKAKVPASDFQTSDRKLSLHALELLSNADLPDLSDYKVVNYDGSNPPMVIEGVKVSVRPDLLIRGASKGRFFCGAIKLHIIQDNKLGEEGQKTAATILHQFITDHVKQDPSEEVLNKLCFSVDIFSQHCESAPAAFKIRMRGVEAACKEFAALWRIAENI